MSRYLAIVRRMLLCAAFVLPAASQAIPVQRDVFFEGQGSLVYDAGTGMGAWLGTIDESAFPIVPTPLSLLSSVSFLFDAGTGLLTGSFEMTVANDFATTLTGLIDGELLQGDFVDGGQFAVNYNILGGSGDFAAASGFGLSLLDFMAPSGGFYDYAEAGVLSFASTPVPEPGALALVALGLFGLLLVRRRKVAARR